MAKCKAYDYDQLVMVPVCLEDQLQPGTLEYTVHYVVEERLDLSSFDAEYRNDETGRAVSCTDPWVEATNLVLSNSFQCHTLTNATDASRF